MIKKKITQLIKIILIKNLKKVYLILKLLKKNMKKVKN